MSLIWGLALLLVVGLALSGRSGDVPPVLRRVALRRRGTLLKRRWRQYPQARIPHGTRFVQAQLSDNAWPWWRGPADPSRRAMQQLRTPRLLDLETTWPDPRLLLEITPFEPRRRVGSGFWDRYLVRGNDEPQIRQMLDQATQGLLDELHRLHAGDIYVCVAHGVWRCLLGGRFATDQELDRALTMSLMLHDQLQLMFEEGIQFLDVDTASAEVGVRPAHPGWVPAGAVGWSHLEMEDEAPRCQICGDPLFNGQPPCDGDPPAAGSRSGAPAVGTGAAGDGAAADADPPPETVYCESCHTPHHLDCWLYNGRCSTYGCASRQFTRSG